MNLRDAKIELQTKEPTFLETARAKVNGKTTYICPSCGNGGGKDGTGIVINEKSKAELPHYKCFNCGLNADVIELWKLSRNISDNAEAFNGVYSYYGIHVDSNQWKGSSATRSPQQAAPQQSQNDYTDYYKACNLKLQTAKAAQDYLLSRGISLETANKCGIGFDEAADPANAPGGIGQKKHPTARIIIPYDSLHYMGRRIDGSSQYQKMNNKQTEGSERASLFNGKALYSSTEPLFVAEGAFDALSIIQAGGEAIATNSTSNIDYLLKLMQQRSPQRSIVIALDADAAGTKGAGKLKEGLEKLNIDYIMPAIPAGKDLNETLQSDRAALEKYVTEAIDNAKKPEEERRKAYYEQNSTAAYIQNFIYSIGQSEGKPAYLTGFNSLDNALDGGLYSGLYCIGAISSLGKTTFCLQIADNLAAAGHDVLFFSLEMAREELMSKSISRLTYIINSQQNGDMSNPKTTRGILTRSRYDNYSTLEKNLIKQAISKYGDIAKHIFINVGIGDIGIEQIKTAVEEHIKITQKKPIVIIDYLQIIAPSDPRSTDKQNTDKAVLGLKRMSRDFDLPIIGISSFNRDNYTAPVNLASFKESGCVEYSSDVLIGLQYLGMDYQPRESDKDRDQRIRELKADNETAARNGQAQQVQVKILKNRNGSKGEAILDFYPMFNYFTDSKASSEQIIEKRTADEKSRLIDAFMTAGDGNRAEIKEIASLMGRRTTTIKQMIDKHEEFKIEGDFVIYDDTSSTL